MSLALKILLIIILMILLCFNFMTCRKKVSEEEGIYIFWINIKI